MGTWALGSATSSTADKPLDVSVSLFSPQNLPNSTQAPDLLHSWLLVTPLPTSPKHTPCRPESSRVHPAVSRLLPLETAHQALNPCSRKACPSSGCPAPHPETRATSLPPFYFPRPAASKPTNPASLVSLESLCSCLSLGRSYHLSLGVSPPTHWHSIQNDFSIMITSLPGRKHPQMSLRCSHVEVQAILARWP